MTTVPTPSPYTPEMRAVLDRLATATGETIDFSRPPDAEARALDEHINAIWNVDLPAVACIRRLVIEPDDTLDAAACDAVVYEPRDPGPGAIFFVHGGGWAFMSLAAYDRFMRVLCNAASCTVAGIHYRLAPEHPYPAAVNDVVSAFRKVIGAPDELGIPPGPVVIAGDSAGGNLAMAIMLHEIDAARELPAGAVLIYPVLGADFATASYEAFADGHLLTRSIMRQFWDWYAPHPATRLQPYANPAMASDDQLRQLPPLHFILAEFDPLASDTTDFKARLDRLERSDTLHTEAGVTHGFAIMTAYLESARRVTVQAARTARKFIVASSG